MKNRNSASIPTLTDAEMEIIRLGQSDPSIITSYFFSTNPGYEPGFEFDKNFLPEGQWQRRMHVAQQDNILVVGGFFSGKTLGVAMSMCVRAITTFPDFRFLNTAATLRQSGYMYSKILSLAKGTPFEKLIHSAPSTPWPKIEIKFWWEDALIESYMDFGSLDSRQASEAISGFEGDIICIDEAFQIPNLEELMIILGSRVRGTFRGRERAGKIVIITNSYPNPYGWYLWDLASSDPENYLSMVVSSRHNLNVTPRQLANALKRIPKDEHEQYIEGLRPVGKGVFFSNESIYACEDAMQGQMAMLMASNNEPGWRIITQHGAGVIYYAEPYQPGHKYLMFGDPGTAGAPNRDAPVWIVWDVTEFPNEPARLACFWWGNGKGVINAFIGNMAKLILLYRPYFVGMDSTGPQKNAATAINLHLRGGRIINPEILSWIGSEVDTSKGIKIPKGTQIVGMDFSVGKKNSMLFSGKMMLDAHRFRWPKIITGLRGQLSMYSPEDDKPGKPRFPQDLVSVVCMSAHAIQALFAISIPDDEDEDDQAPIDSVGGRDAARVRRSGGRSGVSRTPR
jgi:hypothetical protein